MKLPRPTKADRERDAASKVCAELSELLSRVVGFAPCIEPCECAFLKHGGCLSLGTMAAMIDKLKTRKES